MLGSRGLWVAFWRLRVRRFSLKLQEAKGEMLPVFTEGGVTYVWLRYSNVYLLAITKRNSNAMMMLFFLQKLVEVMKEYFGELEEESIKDNFVIIYELLDETMDFGYPQITETAILKEYITTESNVLRRELVRPPQAVTNQVSWRSEGIVHKKNEVYLDVIERLNLMVLPNGTVVNSEIMGTVRVRSFLSGMPTLRLGLNDKLMFEATGRRPVRGKAVELEDVKFHQCVRLADFEEDRTISFIPPDGEFILMTYRLNIPVKPLLWVETVVEKHGRSRVEYMVKAQSHYKDKTPANDVDIFIPVPPDVDTPAFKATIGRVSYVPDLDAIKWSIKQFYGQREFLMRAHFGLPSIESEEGDLEAAWKKPILVRFEIPYFTVSGLQVRYLKVTERSGYQAMPWVRYITQNGDYQIRMR